MEKKNVTQVVIDGTIYKLGGYESEDYILQVASYLNNKITEMKALEGYHRLSAQQKSLMLDLNCADDYFKSKMQLKKMEEELSEKDRQLYQGKHELVQLQVKMDELKKKRTSEKNELEECRKRIRELETELSQNKSVNGYQKR